MELARICSDGARSHIAAERPAAGQGGRGHRCRPRNQPPTAVAFAREGADIIGLDICAPVDPRSGVEPSTQEDWEETGRLVRMAGRRWLGIKLDQRDLPALRAAGVRGEREFGGIDILFANAGIQSFHPLLEMEDPDGYSKRRSGFRALYCEARWRTHHLDLLDRRVARPQVRSLLLGD